MKTWLVRLAVCLLAVFAVYAVSSLIFEKNPHTYFNWSRSIHHQSLALAEWCVKKGIRANTIENIRATNPGMSESSAKHRQAMEFGWLYGQHAWILWKKDRPEATRQNGGKP